MTITRTACTYDCPDACGLRVEVQGEKVILRGDDEHPITRGFVCQRIRRHPERLRSADRLTTPLRRNGAGFESISWDQALDLAASRLREALPEPASIVLVQGGGSLGLSKLLIGHFFRSLGPVTEVGGGVCGEAGEEAQRQDFGDCAGHDFTDLAASRAVVLWGKNSVATGPHLLPFVREAQARGAPVTLVEVHPSPTTRLADRVVQVAPSGDGWLALAVIRLLLDRGGLDRKAIDRTENFEEFERALLREPWREMAARAGADPADVEHLADVYSRSWPVATHLGWGLQRRRSGGRNLRCIDALAALTGNVGVPGGGVTFTSWRRRGLDTSALAPATGRTVAAHRFGPDLAALADPPAKFVYVCAANPVTQFADSNTSAAALRRTGFVVVADAFLSDTARCADLVLPVSLMLEEPDVVGSYGHHHVATARQVLAPPPGARDDLSILRELGRRAGLADDPLLGDPEAALANLVRPWFPDGERSGVGRNPTQAAIPFADGFPTPSGKMRLLTEPPALPPELVGYPLTFLCISHQGWQASQLPAAQQAGPAECFVNPRAPSTEGLQDGMMARLVSPAGSMPVLVRFDARLRTDLALVHRGGSLYQGRGVNALVSSAETDLGGGTAFYDQRVRLEPASGAD